MHAGLVWVVVFVVVAAAILLAVLQLSRLDVSGGGATMTREAAIVKQHTNIMWGLLLIWVAVNIAVIAVAVHYGNKVEDFREAMRRWGVFLEEVRHAAASRTPREG